jgi:hypothetical protein
METSLSDHAMLHGSDMNYIGEANGFQAAAAPGEKHPSAREGESSVNVLAGIRRKGH